VRRLLPVLWWILFAARLAAQEVRVLFFDVGQADAALVETPEGRRVLIDAGRERLALARRLHDQGIDTLDLVVASHNHADHIGGMAEVLRSLVVLNYLDNGVPYETAAARAVRRLVRERGIRYLAAERRVLALGSVRLVVLSSPPGDGEQYLESVGLLVEYGKFRALFTGDSEVAELEHWLAADSIPTVTLLKAAHHGSANGVTERWARATRPAVVVISVGVGNSYGHPAPEVVALWCRLGAAVYRTDSSGSIEVRGGADGQAAVRRLERPASLETPVNACGG
jgi:beta-lactamase superfamily II metal-dependent hydrolase